MIEVRQKKTDRYAHAAVQFASLGSYFRTQKSGETLSLNLVSLNFLKIARPVNFRTLKKAEQKKPLTKFIFPLLSNKSKS